MVQAGNRSAEGLLRQLHAEPTYQCRWLQHARGRGGPRWEAQASAHHQWQNVSSATSCIILQLLYICMPCTLVYVGVSNRLKAWWHDSCALYGRSASTSSKQSAHGSHHYPRSWNRQARWHLLHYRAVSFLNICVQIYGTWMEWLSFSSVPFKVQASEFKPWFAFFAEKKTTWHYCILWTTNGSAFLVSSSRIFFLLWTFRVEKFNYESHRSRAR